MTLREPVTPAVVESWSMRIEIEEEDVRTVAIATLRTGKRMLQGRGAARRNPIDPNLPRVGADLAVSRALSALAHDLLNDAAGQLETATHAPAGIRGA